MEKFLFHVVIDKRLCEVYEREETHKFGEWNGKPNNWWVKWINHFDDNGTEEIDWIPWVDCCTNRLSWEITISIGNRLVYKNDYDIRCSGSVLIKCNTKPVYWFGASNIEYAFARAQYLIHVMNEHPFSFVNPESEIGRKIWYHNQPGIVSGLSLDSGDIYIKHDGDGGFDMKHVYDEKDEVSDWQGQETIRDDVLSPSIWWFRK
jgi:hypothetical protein